jgi:ABC-type nitrate/sulfonate/bicarbonate transport system ATPase subunit
MSNYKLGQTILCLDKVSVGYDGKMILKDVSLIEKDVIREGFAATGQTIAFIGRSGRGKSTLFKALTGLLKPTSGQVLINDIRTADSDDAKVVSEGDVGFVDQKYTLFRHKTIYQICHYALRKSTKTQVEKDELINKHLIDWGLQEHKDKYSCELSGGQRQRTSLLENILYNKRFLILDEPASGLDVCNIEKLKQYFTQFSNENELNTIIFSTHDLHLAVELADSIYIIGFPEGEKEFSTIIKHYDLKQMGIAWKEFGQEHIELIKDIKALLAVS